MSTVRERSAEGYAASPERGGLACSRIAVGHLEVELPNTPRQRPAELGHDRVVEDCSAEQYKAQGTIFF